jgi:hypothetical protein
MRVLGRIVEYERIQADAAVYEHFFKPAYENIVDPTGVEDVFNELERTVTR